MLTILESENALKFMENKCLFTIVMALQENFMKQSKDQPPRAVVELVSVIDGL